MNKHTQEKWIQIDKLKELTDEEDFNFLTELAKAKGISVSILARTCIKHGIMWYLENERYARALSKEMMVSSKLLDNKNKMPF